MWTRWVEWVKNARWGGVFGAGAVSSGNPDAPPAGPGGDPRLFPPGLIEVVFRNGLGHGKECDEREAKLEHLARWLEREHPSAAASLREGLSEMFTINRLGLPPAVRRCLGTTNLIDSTHSGARQKARSVTNWKNGEMALRWAAGAFIETEKSYRKILRYRHLWVLKAHLDEEETIAKMENAS